MLTELERGVRVSGAVVNVTAVVVANATVIFQASNFAQQVGTKSFKPRKIRVRNNAGGQLWLNLGTGAAATYVDQFPQVRVLDNMDSVWQEVELPEVELFADMTCWCDALVAGGSIDVQIEAEECG